MIDFDNKSFIYLFISDLNERLLNMKKFFKVWTKIVNGVIWMENNHIFSLITNMIFMTIWWHIVNK